MATELMADPALDHPTNVDGTAQAAFPNRIDAERVDDTGKPLPQDIGFANYTPDTPEEKTLVRKMDMRLFPTLWIMYVLNYLDRTNIGNAQIAGMATDLDLTGSRYNWALSIFFFGYLLNEVPSNMILARTRPSIFLPGIMVAWGIISACTAAVQSYPGLLVIRFVLGLVESGFFPGVLFLLSSWYKRTEIAKRMAVFYSGAIISGAFGGLLAGGITSSLNGVHGIAGWRYLFLIEGVATIGVSFIAVFILPDFPTTTSWLTPEEKRLAVDRLIADGHDPRSGKHEGKKRLGFMPAIKDWRTWAFTLLYMMDVCAGTISYFFPTITKNIAGNATNAQYLTVPFYLVAALFSLSNSFHADHQDERAFHIIAFLCVAFVGFVISAATTNNGALYFAQFLCATGIWSALPVILAWVSHTISSPPEKRAVSLAIVNAIANLSSVWGAQLFPSSDSPRFLKGFITNAAFCFVGILTALSLRIALPRYVARHPEVTAEEIEEKREDALRQMSGENKGATEVEQVENAERV
ncbi:hypothetical protein BZG36_01816 [Bifiguratus adelaidae]|uniref:Major facilitator superfamily (MFS) profile domain-containing protein n=1 Tax=Bifiguratus adelaidae TaxID=1938954 RepID=A0A261Y254_9FUNG|nr:hypothetical protein BZG36_01816 [Bifiguratus adelaidae]